MATTSERISKMKIVQKAIRAVSITEKSARPMPAPGYDARAKDLLLKFRKATPEQQEQILAYAQRLYASQS